MFKQSVLLVAAWTACGISALAADYPPAYDAVYTQTFDGKPSTMTMASNGKGLMKSVMVNKSGNVEIIIDYPGKMTTTIMHQEKMWGKTPLKESFKDQMATLKEGKSLGTKSFNGHTCNGYETKTENGVSQTWLGNDNQVMVHFEKDTGVAKNITDLKTYSDKAGDVTFSIPKGFKDISASVK